MFHVTAAGYSVDVLYLYRHLKAAKMMDKFLIKELAIVDIGTGGGFFVDLPPSRRKLCTTYRCGAGEHLHIEEPTRYGMGNWRYSLFHDSQHYPTIHLGRHVGPSSPLRKRRGKGSTTTRTLTQQPRIPSRQH
ncbi:unnamed protein product [Nesidiocoris tenuis]|uniref:Uncharacterized protein n=1 Tax=Nesidiocoris tenuis TaxID=355587 RepID=A0A6H5HI67_9HEMI|nr:unnamed protein product [Nesidiocoris tenuis]